MLQGHLESVLAKGKDTFSGQWWVLAGETWGFGGDFRNLSDSIEGTPRQAGSFPASGHHCLRTSLRTSVIILGP